MHRIYLPSQGSQSDSKHQASQRSDRPAETTDHLDNVCMLQIETCHVAILNKLYTIIIAIFSFSHYMIMINHTIHTSA